MDDRTIKELNTINRNFYVVTADEFDQTRGQAWIGWERLLPYTTAIRTMLDVGCGNGRFGIFLAENLPQPLVYQGIDNSPQLLAYTHTALSAHPSLTVKLQSLDIVQEALPPMQYDLVVIFGVLHHVPGSAQRLDLIRMLAARVAPGGVLAFACWRFYDFERFRSRIIPWSAELADRVEPGDYLLDWRRGEVALRYCHYVDDTEHDQLVQAAGMEEVERYHADGSTGTLNQYSILRKT